jgi:hypothetical protein
MSKLYLGAGIVSRESPPQATRVEALAVAARSPEEAEDWANARLRELYPTERGWANHRAKMFPIARHQVASWLASYDYDKGREAAGGSDERGARPEGRADHQTAGPAVAADHAR